MPFYNRIYHCEEMSHRAKVVYIYLKDHADKNGTCWPGIKTIAKDLKISVSTVKRALNDLYSLGLVSKKSRWRENGSHTSNLYTLLDEKEP
mgnify:CR=1 FL=1